MLSKREFLDHLWITKTDGSRVNLTEDQKDEWVNTWEAIESGNTITRYRRRQLGNNVMMQAYLEYYEATFGKDKIKLIK
mgnify:CR=1 FL=1